ncbi:MAG: hypothetical protein ACRDSP_07240 [Pseudonocardiaceae bacterium]
MSRVRQTLALAVAALICLATAQGCSTTVDGPAVPVAGNTTSDLRDTAVHVAEQTAIALTSLDHRDPDGGYDRLLALLTGPARQEWEQRRVDYLARIKSERVTANGAAIKASGVADLDPAATTATVLVASTAMVSTKQVPAQQKRRYRLRMDLIRSGAQWKVSQLQVVS